MNNEIDLFAIDAKNIVRISPEYIDHTTTININDSKIKKLEQIINTRLVSLNFTRIPIMGLTIRIITIRN